MLNPDKEFLVSEEVNHELRIRDIEAPPNVTNDFNSDTDLVAYFRADIPEKYLKANHYNQYVTWFGEESANPNYYPTWSGNNNLYVQKREFFKYEVE